MLISVVQMKIDHI